MLGINLMALVMLIVGFVVGWKIIRRGRTPFELKDTLFSWREIPASVFHYDRLAGFLIIVHTLATLTLGFLLLCSVNRAGISPFSMAFHSPIGTWLATIVGYQDMQIRQLSILIAVLSSGIGAFICGSLLSFPFARYFIRPILVHLHPEGIIYGQNSMQWQDVSSYQVDPKRHLIKLFRHSHPRSPSFVLHPSDDTLFTEVERKIHEFLSDKETDSTSPSWKRRWLSGFFFLLITFILMLCALWVFQYTIEWVWFLYAAGIVAFAAGGRVLEHI